MAFFEFRGKIPGGKEYSLEDIPLFSSLTPTEHKLIEKRSRIVQYKRGDIVYQEGTASDAFYVVISGRFRLFNVSKGGGKDQTLLFFYRGDHFGETSLLTGKPHSATVESKSDGLILRIEKDDFVKLIQEVPAIPLHLSRSLGHRLTKSEGADVRREVKIAALFSTHDPEIALQLWLDLAASVVQQSRRKVIVVDFVHGRPPLLRQEFLRGLAETYDLGKVDSHRDADIRASLMEHAKGYFYVQVISDALQDGDEKKISSLVTFLTYRYDFLMLRLPNSMNHPCYSILKQSDNVYLFSDSNSAHLKKCNSFISDLLQSHGFGKSDLKVIVTDPNVRDEKTYEEYEVILGQRIFSLLPVKADQPERYEGSLRYLAKEWSGTLIGLALGSGAAYGLAHIGVLKVLEEEGVPVDVVSGSSIGALVGALFAAGFNAKQMVDFANEIDKKSGFFKLIGFRDLSMPHRGGFFKGNQANRFLNGILGDRTFQEMNLPLKVIGTNLFTSEAVTFEAGRVVDAVRASIAIPGIFRPFFYKGDYLIDGGVIDPLPVRVLTQIGCKKIIAVNVLLGPKDRIARNRLLEEFRQLKLKEMAEKNLWSKMLAQILEKLKDRYTINIFNVIMNTIQFMEYEIAETWASKADVVIHPVVYEGHWAQFYAPEKFIKAGEEKTRELLGEIKRLMVE